MVVWMASGVAIGGQEDQQKVGPRDMNSTMLIPRSTLFDLPDKADPRISPDGSKLSYLADVNGVSNLWIGPLDDPSAVRPVTEDVNRGIAGYDWAFNNTHVWYLQDEYGDGNWHIHAMNLKTNETRDLTPLSQVWPRFQRASHKFPGELLIGIDDRDPQLYDLYRVNIENAERRMVQKNDGYMKYTADDDFNVWFASQVTPEGGAEFFKRVEGSDTWTSFMTISHVDAMMTGPVDFDKTGKILYMADSTGRDTTALVAYNLQTNEKKVLALSPRTDFTRAMVHPTEKTVEAVSFAYQRREWKILDESVKADFDYLRTVADGELNVVDRTLDDKRWIVAYLMDDGPVRFYDYDRAAKRARFLFTDRKALENLPLTTMHSVVIKARDGLDLISYVSLPVWADADGDGRPTAPLPMVLLVHSGPWIRSSWGFNPLAQWLANRGYAVLSVNFRGSVGFGKNFVSAGNLEWGRKMHDDLIDGVNWAIKWGIADPKRVAIMGTAYGGYATLTGLTVTPDIFACGVDLCGPSNLITLLESVSEQWKPVVDTYATRAGDHRTEEGRALLTERSPLTHVERIRKPLLIGHGARDPRVKQAECDRIVEVMQAKKLPVTLVVFDDEGHGLARMENIRAFVAVTEAFLARHLGGRHEPIGKDLEDSSMIVPKGADQVPGLAETLSKPAKALPQPVEALPKPAEALPQPKD